MAIGVIFQYLMGMVRVLVLISKVGMDAGLTSPALLSSLPMPFLYKPSKNPILTRGSLHNTFTQCKAFVHML